MRGYVSGVVLTFGWTDGARGLECARSGAAPAEGCGRVRWTAGGGVDARGGPRTRGRRSGVFLFVNLRAGSVRYSSYRRYDAFVDGCRRARSETLEKGGVLRSVESGGKGRGFVDLIEWEDRMRRQ